VVHGTLASTGPEWTGSPARSRWLRALQAFPRGIAISFATFFVLCIVLPLLAFLALFALPLLIVALPCYAGYRILEARRRIREELPEKASWWWDDEDEPEPRRDWRCAICGRRLKLRHPPQWDSDALCRKCCSRFALSVGSPERSRLETAFERYELRRRGHTGPAAPACAACGAEQTGARTWTCDFCVQSFCSACYGGHFRERRRWHLPRLRAAARKASPATHEAETGEARP
jgi:hypothetical protein